MINKNQVKTIISIFLMLCLLVPLAGAAYVFRQDGTITINAGSLYIDGMTITDYIDSRALAMSGFDQSLNTTDDVTFNTITLSGVQRATWPSVSGNNSVSTASYVVYTDGANIIAVEGTTGAVAYNTTNAADTINAAIDSFGAASAYEGLVYVLKGQYDLNETILMGKKTHLVGEQGALLNLVDNVNAITIRSTHEGSHHSLRIQGFSIDMNEVEGHAIYGAHITGAIDSKSYFGHLSIWDVKAGYSGMYLQDLLYSTLEHIRIRTKGTGITFAVDEAKTVHYGNLHASDIFIIVQAANGIGVDIQGGATYRTCNLAQFDRLQIQGDNYAGTVGLRLYRDNYISFDLLNIEQCAKGVYMYNSRHNTFTNPTIVASANTQYGFELEGSCYNNIIIGGVLQAQTQSYYDHSTADAWQQNHIFGTKLDTATNTFTRTALNDAYIQWKKTENAGTATITAGQTFITVTHYLYTTPDIIIATPQSNAGNWWTSNIGSTTFRINISGALGSNVVFSWYATVATP